jgi:hypothetical protein
VKPTERPTAANATALRMYEPTLTMTSPPSGALYPPIEGKRRTGSAGGG